MFSSELHRVKHPLSARVGGVVLGSIISLAVAAPLISARTTPYVLAVTVASFLIAAVMRAQISNAVPRKGPVFWHLTAFLLYAAASAAWGVAPEESFLAVALAILVALGTLVVVQLTAVEARPDLLHMGEGLWCGFVFGLLYLMIEMASGQSIKIWLYNLIGIQPGHISPPSYFEWSGSRLVAISPDDLKRNISALVLFLWPAVLAMIGTLAKPRATVLAVLSALLATAAVLSASHGTSKLAIIGGFAAFGGACFFLQLTGRLVALAWIIACIGVLPAALLAHRFDLHNAAWLEPSTRHRIIIWNFTAEQALRRPLLGIGARSTYVLGPRLEKMGMTRSPDERLPRTLSTHSHSIYLQTWFELGVVGITLLTLSGLAILQAIHALAARLQPYAYATFTSGAIVAASSYGMWQIWFIAMFGLSAAFFSLGVGLSLTREPTADVSA